MDESKINDEKANRIVLPLSKVEEFSNLVLDSGDSAKEHYELISSASDKV